MRNIAAPIPALKVRAGKKICWMFSHGSLVSEANGSRGGKIVERRGKIDHKPGANHEARDSEPDY